MKVQVYNLSKDNILLDKAYIADNFFTRLKGLLGKDGLDSGEGLIIKPCNSIHTIGMKFPIDVAFLDKDDRVVHIMNNIPSGRFSPIVKKAKYVIETKAGELALKGLEIGDILQLRQGDVSIVRNE